MITKLLRRAMAYDEPWAYTLLASDYSPDSCFSELQLVATWNKWGLCIEVEVDEYATYDYVDALRWRKRRWWLVLQVGPWSLVYSRERRVS